MDDTEFRRIAIEESRKGDRPYGAVIVKDGVIVFKGFNTATRDRDPTAHAEVNVIRAAWLVTAAHGGRQGGFIATTVAQASIVDVMPGQWRPAWTRATAQSTWPPSSTADCGGPSGH